MNRLACGCLLALAACGVKGPPTGMADVTGTTPPVMSAGANSFSGQDAAGDTVLGWTIYLFSNGPGANCNSADTKVVASVGIYSNQIDDGTDKKAQLAEAEVSIVQLSPPPVNGSAAATMGAEGLTGIGGTVTITDFYVNTDGSIDHISGMINATGLDDGGSAVSLSGSFTAPNCD